jgi:hypothetical protein
MKKTLDKCNAAHSCFPGGWAFTDRPREYRRVFLRCGSLC